MILFCILPRRSGFLNLYSDIIVFPGLINDLVLGLDAWIWSQIWQYFLQLYIKDQLFQDLIWHTCTGSLVISHWPHCETCNGKWTMTGQIDLMIYWSCKNLVNQKNINIMCLVHYLSVFLLISASTCLPLL